MILFSDLERRNQRAAVAGILSLACATLLIHPQASALPPRVETPRAEGPGEITINEAKVSAENLTATRDGTIYFGSTANGTIYRARPDQAQADAWIPAAGAGLTNVLGVLADEKSNTLWVCDNAPFGRNQGPAPAPAGLPALRSFDLKTGVAKGTFPAPNGGVCNDIALAADGTAYVTDTFGGRILRHKPDGQALEVWLADPQLRGLDGLSLLADGALYVNNFYNGKLIRIPVREDGSAGPVGTIPTTVAFTRPDGMRASGPTTLLQVEGQGRLTEITIVGDRGEVRVIREGLTNAAGVTQVGSTALVLVERRKAVTVPIAADGARVPTTPPQ